MSVYLDPELRPLYEEYHSADMSEDAKAVIADRIAVKLRSLVDIMWRICFANRGFMRPIMQELKQEAWLEMWDKVLKGECDFDLNVPSYLIECGKRVVVRRWQKYWDPRQSSVPMVKRSIPRQHSVVNVSHYVGLRELMEEGYTRIRDARSEFRFGWPWRTIYDQVVSYYEENRDRPSITDMRFPRSTMVGDRLRVVRSVVFHAALCKFNEMYDRLMNDYQVVKSSQRY